MSNRKFRNNEAEFFILLYDYLSRKYLKNPQKQQVREVEVKELKDPTGTVQEQLNKLIGLQDVKREIKKLTNMSLLQKKRRDAGKKVVNSSMHLVFTGNPGTGKTTVARLVGQIFKEIGILKSGHMIEADRSTLVGEYVGHTEKKVKEAVEKAKDGVLFIDEAYALASQGGNDYGKLAIDTLIKLMEDNRDCLSVIVAGYTEPMQEFISSNHGLQSRFTRYISFEDYSVDELFDIFQSMMGNVEYKLDSNAEEKVKRVLMNHWLIRDDHFGNGRDVRTMFERVIENQASRIVSSQVFDNMDLVEENDIPNNLVINIKSECGERE